MIRPKPPWLQQLEDNPALSRHVDENMMQILRGANWLAHVAGRERNAADIEEAKRLFVCEHEQHLANIEALLATRGQT